MLVAPNCAPSIRFICHNENDDLIFFCIHLSVFLSGFVCCKNLHQLTPRRPANLGSKTIFHVIVQTLLKNSNIHSIQVCLSNFSSSHRTETETSQVTITFTEAISKGSGRCDVTAQRIKQQNIGSTQFTIERIEETTRRHVMCCVRAQTWPRQTSHKAVACVVNRVG